MYLIDHHPAAGLYGGISTAPPDVALSSILGRHAKPEEWNIPFPGIQLVARTEQKT